MKEKKAAKRQGVTDRATDLERSEEKARTGAAARLSGRLRKTDGEEAADEKGRGGGTAGGEPESLTHS